MNFDEIKYPSIHPWSMNFQTSKVQKKTKKNFELCFFYLIYIIRVILISLNLRFTSGIEIEQSHSHLNSDW